MTVLARSRPWALPARAVAWLAPALVLAGAAALRLWAFGGLTFAHGGDDARYVAVAQNLAMGELPDGPAEWFGSRVVFLWPVAAAFRVWGASDLTAAAWPLVGSLLAVLAAYLLGRDLASRRVGLVAAGLVAVAPLEVLMATRLRPDAIMPGLVALAVWCAWRAGGAPRPGPWLAGAGVLVGAGWSVRESALVMAPVVVAAAWPALRNRPRRVLVALGGLATVPLLSVLTFAVAAGRPLWPLTATAAASEVRGPLEGWRATTSYLEQLARGAVDPRSVLLLALPVVAAALVVLAARRERRAALPAAWLTWAALYLEVGTLANLDKPQRFLTLCSVPAALLVALALDGRWAPLAVPAVALVGVLVLAPWPAREERRDDVLLVSRVAAAMRDLPPGPLLAESHTWWAKLSAYLPAGRLPVAPARDPAFLGAGSRAEARRLDPLPAPRGAAGGYVVVGPVHPRAGWPRNWGAFRARFRAEVPWGRLVAVRRVGPVVVYRWPAT